MNNQTQSQTNISG